MFFRIFKFFRNKVNACFFHNFFYVVIFRQCIYFFFYKLFSFFKFFLSVCSIKVVVSIKNHIVSCFFNNLFDFCCVIRINKFFFHNSAFFNESFLSFALFSYFSLCKLNSVHYIVFRYEFASCFNHNYRIMCTCNYDI